MTDSKNTKSAVTPEAIPFIKDFAFAYGTPDIVLPGVKRIIAHNPGPFTYTGSGTYLISNDDFSSPVAIIDPGPNLDQHLDALIKVAAPAGISHILITHTHSDHCGGARSLSERCGAPIYGFSGHPVEDPLDDAPALDEGADYDFAPDIQITDKSVIDGDGWSIETVATPGHLSNHLCFALPRERALFTGDHIMGWATTVIIPPDGDMGDYFDSLDKLLQRDDEIYLPTHGAPIHNPQRFVRAVRAHRRMRDGQILHQLRSGNTRIAQMVSAMYAGVDKRLHVAASLNVLAHLIRLCRIEQVSCDGLPSLKAAYCLNDETKGFKFSD